MRVGSAGSSTRLSNRKSLWINAVPRSGGWWPASQAITVSASGTSGVRARR